MYRIKTTFLLALIFICQIACAQKKETVYLLFKDNNPVNCIKIESKSPKRDDTLRVKYEGYMRNHGNISRPSYVICMEKFLLAKGSKIEKINASEINKLNIVDFDYFIKRRFETNKVTKSSVFYKIYFLEKINDNEYMKYEVYWNQSVHNRGI